MFTGIIEEVGRIEAFQMGGRGASIRVGANCIPARLKAGDSVAVNGVCLTAIDANATSFVCELSDETLRRTALARAGEGTAVNLERPVMVGSRLGGHFVLGHADGVGKMLVSKPSATGVEMTFAFPRELDRYLVFKGSIAVDGISLTIASLEETYFSVAVIPHTLENTNLKCLRSGSPVNLEVDILGKYFERFFQLGLLENISSRITADYLKEQGF